MLNKCLVILTLPTFSFIFALSLLSLSFIRWKTLDVLIQFDQPVRSLLDRFVKSIGLVTAVEEAVEGAVV